MSMFRKNFVGRGHLLVAMSDGNVEKRELHYITLDNALNWNERRYGIFLTVQAFNGHRKKENLERIIAWAIDIDDGTKEEQKARIRKSPLPPSSVVESKNGFHCYWLASNATIENFDRIQQMLVAFFNADKNAKDLCRLLRLPCCFHWKNQNDPFLVKEVEWHDREYTEEKMLEAFGRKMKPQEKQASPKSHRVYEKSHPLYDKNSKAENCMEGLRVLSGSSPVNGDEFEFKPNADGTFQIWVNGKSTACWIDKRGLIGSHDKGGPTLIQWLQWYGYDPKGASEILKDYL